MATSGLSWKPRRRRVAGGSTLYCSPACGAGCTLQGYEEVRKLNERLARRLGDGWTTEIWENLGWHGVVVSPCGRVTVKANRFLVGTTTYDAAFHPPGTADWKLMVSKLRTPERAVRRVVEVAGRYVAQYGATLTIPVRLQGKELR